MPQLAGTLIGAHRPLPVSTGAFASTTGRPERLPQPLLERFWNTAGTIENRQKERTSSLMERTAALNYDGTNPQVELFWHASFVEPASLIRLA